MDNRIKAIAVMSVVVVAFLAWYVMFSLMIGVPSQELYHPETMWLVVNNAGAEQFRFEAVSSSSVLIVSLILYLAFKYEPEGKNRFGDARFATPKEILDYGYCIGKGIIVGQTQSGKLLFSHGPKTVGLAAKPRSGKGVSFVIPNLLNWPGSAVAIDIKKELFEITSGYRSKFQNVYCFDPLNPDGESHTLNIFDTIDKSEKARVTEVQKIAKALMPDGKDAFWDGGGRKIFMGIALYLLEMGKHCSVPAIMDWAGGKINLQEKMLMVLEKDHKNLSKRCITLLREYAEFEPDSKLVSGYLEAFNDHLQIFNSPMAAAATDKTNINIHDLKTNPKTIYLVSRPEDIGVLGKLFGLITDNLVFSLTKGKPVQGETGKVLMMLDEFTALGELKRLKEGAAFLGGFGVRLAIIYQNHAQLETKYGVAGAKELVGLMHERIMFASSDIDEAERVRRELGQKTVKAKSYSYNKSGRSKSVSEAGKDLLTADQIKRLDNKKQIILSAEQRPILCNKIFYYKDKRFTERLMAETANVPLLDVEKYIYGQDEDEFYSPSDLKELEIPDELTPEELADLA